MFLLIECAEEGGGGRKRKEEGGRKEEVPTKKHKNPTRQCGE